MIRFNSNPDELILILVGAICFFGLGLFLTLRPIRGAQLLARVVSVYQKAFGLSDQQLDNGTLPFQRSLLGGGASRFAKLGSKAPEEFPGVISYARAFGVVLVTMFGLALCVVLGLFLLSLFLKPGS